MSAMLEYSEINSPIHKLTGATKLICLVIWALASMVTYDTRILVVMVICSIAIFKISKVEFKTVSFVFYLILVFLLINNIAIFIPYCRSLYCNYRTVILSIKYNIKIFCNNTYGVIIYSCYKSK